MATSKWIASTRSGNSTGVTVLSTELTSLANDAAATSAAVENDTALDLYADFELVISHGVAPTADKTWDLYLIRSVDGSLFEDATALRPPANGFVGSFVLDNTASSQRHVLPGIMVPPRTHKLFLVNKSGQAAGSGTLKAFYYNQQVS